MLAPSPYKTLDMLQWRLERFGIKFPYSKSLLVALPYYKGYFEVFLDTGAVHYHLTKIPRKYVRVCLQPASIFLENKETQKISWFEYKILSLVINLAQQNVPKGVESQIKSFVRGGTTKGSNISSPIPFEWYKKHEKIFHLPPQIRDLIIAALHEAKMEIIWKEMQDFHQILSQEQFFPLRNEHIASLMDLINLMAFDNITRVLGNGDLNDVRCIHKNKQKALEFERTPEGRDLLSSLPNVFSDLSQNLKNYAAFIDKSIFKYIHTEFGEFSE